MKLVRISDFKARCLAILDEVATAKEGVIITRRGKALARIIPNASEKDTFPQSELRGTIEEVSDDLSSVLPSSAWEMNRNTKGSTRS